ncbi:MAG TPA: GNAT family N-acetyltransferase [Gemmatimonadaceae bacterium]|nr:GNAT family N-acetyltransferase [Gemmatimonadaceae bacterium]
MRVRDADAADAPAISSLLGQLGHATPEADVRSRMRRLGSTDRVLIAEVGERACGLVTTHLTPVLHRAGPVGRITSLVVSDDARGSGVGRALVEAAERLLVEQGCVRIEVTSGRLREGAHRFYERLGYENQGIRFAKPVAR